jgi:hypothetical protein
VSIYTMHDVFPEIGRARAAATGRCWFLMQDTRTGRQRMTDDPLTKKGEMVMQVFRPAAAATTAEQISVSA